MERESSLKSSRSRSNTRKYRTIAPTSQVDETLFGKPMREGMRENSSCKAKKLPQRNKDGETIQVITRDLIRNLRVKDSSGLAIILPSAEYEQIVSRSRVLTKEEKQGLKEASQRKKEEETKAAQDWRHEILEANLKNKKKNGLTELELQSQACATRVVEHTNALKSEQEEEIRKLNTLILGVQCQATRDAQIKEKQQIQVEMSVEEKRLDNMMEVERRKILETMDQIDELRKHQRLGGMQEIYNQIQERSEKRQLLEELKEQEKQQIHEKQKKMDLEDQEGLERKREAQKQLQKEVMRINAETMKAKELRKEEEKLADMRDMEYIRNKQEREVAYEAEQRRIKKEKELEIARLRAQQQRANDYTAEQDEIRLRRNQEVADREWRKKEKELAEKKAQEEAMLRVAHLEQVQCKEHFLSIEAAREKAEVERILRAQKEMIKKEREAEEKRRLKAKHYTEALLHQVKERELSAIAKQREISKETACLMEDTQLRRVRLDEIREKKLKELKATGLSEKYCSVVERKARTCFL
ncbi:cilia- and flagella-associated protein 45 [Halichoeres trimaculatus]|uniref:cilia- and flagella-associated protein 45 n=1 Tax=Halichoeres trimaculatus TaxID=147232 RepID=UPI003D9FACCB